MVITNDTEAWKRAWSFRDHGRDSQPSSESCPPRGFRWMRSSFGTNWRLTKMQSALGRVLLEKLPERVEKRRRNAAILTSEFSKIPGLRVTPAPAEIGHAYYKYYAFVRPEALVAGWDRDRILAALNAEGIPSFVGSCSEIYLEKAFSNGLRPLERYRVGRDLGETSLMFLVHSTLGDGDMRDTCRAVENFPRTQRSTFLSAGVVRQISDRNTVSFRYSFYDWSDRGKGVGGLTLPDAAANNTSRRHYLYLSDRDTISDHLINELSVRLGTSDTLTVSQFPSQPRIIVLGAFTGGSAQQNLSQSRDYVQLTDALFWSAGNHVIKAGINVPEISRWSLNEQSNFGGTFQFSSLADYQLNRPFSFVQQQGNPRLVYWYRVLGAFVQDDVRLRPDLSLSVGVRYDWQNMVAHPHVVAPRIALAYAPGKAGKTVFRAGGGIFYETAVAQTIADVLRFNEQTLRQIVVSNPVFPDLFSLDGTAQSLPSSLVQLAPGFRLPYLAQYTVGVERQLSKSMTFTTTYTGIWGFDLFRSVDVNAPLPPLYTLRPNPAISTDRQIQSAGRSRSEALTLAMRGKVSHYFDGMVQYTLARSYDNTEGVNWFPANQYDQTGEWSRSDLDARHSVNAHGTFHAGDLFTLGIALSAHSGLPYTVTTGNDDFGTTFANARPPGVPRNSLQGPGAIMLDTRLARDFALHANKKKDTEGPTLTLALDAFNVLNHVNFGPPVGDLTSPFFGQPITATSARRLQVSLGFQF